jgi:hypothetical protein
MCFQVHDMAVLPACGHRLYRAVHYNGVSELLRESSLVYFGSADETMYDNMNGFEEGNNVA